MGLKILFDTMKYMIERMMDWDDALDDVMKGRN